MRQFLTRKLVSSTRRGGASVRGRPRCGAVDHLLRPFIPHGNAWRASGFSYQRLTGTYRCGFHDVFTKFEMIGCQHDNRRSVLEPPELIAFADADVARKDGRPARCRIEHDIQKMQPDTCNQY